MDAEFIREVVTIILFVMATACLTAPLVWLTLWLGRRMREGAQDAAGEAATRLGLRPEPLAGPSGSADASPETVYKGTVDGVEISVGVHTQTILAGSPNRVALPLAPVMVAASLPAPLPFSLHIGRVANPPGPVILLDDAAFDRELRVSTNDEPAARALLSAPELRSMIREFMLGSSAGHAIVTETAVLKNVFDAHLKGEVSVLQAVRDVVAVAKAVVLAEGREAPSLPARREGVPRLSEAQGTTPVRDWREDLSESLKKRLPRFKELRIVAIVPVPQGIPLKEAHHFAPGDRGIAGYDTPPGFSRRFTDERLPGGLTRVEVECDEVVSCDTRNLYYNYAGRYLCLLVFPSTGEIWDARWESAP